jgi:hypothetical protein
VRREMMIRWKVVFCIKNVVNDEGIAPIYGFGKSDYKGKVSFVKWVILILKILGHPSWKEGRG